MGEHFFWITSRAAGTAALLLASAAVCVGLLAGERRLKVRDVRAIHEALSLATIVGLVVHAVSLLGDSFLKPSLADISVPFASGYRQPWMSIGIVAGWSLIALGLSYYARGRIGPTRWRRLHRFTALAWIGGIVHALGEGTDAGSPWFLLATAALAVPASGLLARRLLADRGRPVVPAGHLHGP